MTYTNYLCIISLVHCRLPQSTLLRELDFVRSSLPPEHGLPAPIRLSVIGDQLELATGTTALATNSLTLIADDRRGTTAVRASLFRQLVDQLAGHELTFDAHAGRLSVTWPDGHASLPETTLPVFDTSLGGELSQLRLPALALRDLLAQTKAAWAEKHISIPGVLLELTANRLRLVGLDGYAMAVVDRAVEGVDVGTVILPSGGLQAMVNMLADTKGDALLTVGDKCVRLAAGNRSATVRVAAGKFPSYERILPPVHESPVVMHSRDLVAAVRRVVSTGGDEEFAQVTFQCRRDNVTLESDASREEFSAAYAGADVDIRFDSKRLNKILSAVQSERVELYVGAERQPAMFKPQGDTSATFILVPIRK